MPSGRGSPSAEGAVKLSPFFTIMLIQFCCSPGINSPVRSSTIFRLSAARSVGSSRTGRKLSSASEYVPVLLFQQRAETHPRCARIGVKAGLILVSCPQEYIRFQFLIYPLSLSSILSHSLLWGVPRSESPEPLLPLPTDGARSV